jgi:hypothetical protein
MAKRFRDTERRKLPSYRKLSFKAKGILTYLQDNCTSAGVWYENFEEASRFLGVDFDSAELMSILAGWVVKFYDGMDEAYFIPSFFDEQYAEAKDTFSAKIAAIRDLKKLGLMDENGCLVCIQTDCPPTLPPQSPDCPPTVGGLSRYSTGGGGGIKEGGVGETKAPAAEVPNSPDDSSSQPGNFADSSPPPQPEFGVIELAEAWNRRMAEDPSNPIATVDVSRLRPEQDRWKAAELALAETPVRSHAEWVDVIDRIARSKFCRGKGTKNGWKADFDFLVRPGVATRVLEGKYGCKPKPPDVPVAPASEPEEPPPQINPEKLPPHLRKTFAVVTGKGKPGANAGQPGLMTICSDVAERKPIAGAGAK